LNSGFIKNGIKVWQAAIALSYLAWVGSGFGQSATTNTVTTAHRHPAGGLQGAVEIFPRRGRLGEGANQPGAAPVRQGAYRREQPCGAALVGPEHRAVRRFDRTGDSAADAPERTGRPAPDARHHFFFIVTSRPHPRHHAWRRGRSGRHGICRGGG